MLEPGLDAEITHVVTASDTAQALGSTVVAQGTVIRIIVDRERFLGPRSA